MGLILVPSEIMSKSISVKTALSNIVAGYQNVLTQVSNFANDEALQSNSWAKLKEKVLEYHTYIEQGMSVVQGSVETDLATLEGSIGSETLDEDELVGIIESLENEKKNCEEAIENWNIQKNSMAIYVVNSNLCSMIERGIEILEQEIENLNELINTYKEKLEFLYMAEDSTKNLFDASITFLAAMESLINEAGVKISNEKITDSVSSVKWQDIIPNVEDVSVNIEDNFAYNWGKKELPNSEQITLEFMCKVCEIAEKLKISPDDLMAVIAFESRFNPQEENANGALGLIQFTGIALAEINRMNGTNYTKDDIREMNAIEQLDIVYLYYKPKIGKMNDLGDVYLVTFAPAFVDGTQRSDDTVIYSSNDPVHPEYYKYNSGLDKEKKGYITKGDTYAAVLARREEYEY